MGIAKFSYKKTLTGPLLGQGPLPGVDKDELIKILQNLPEDATLLSLKEEPISGTFVEYTLEFCSDYIKDGSEILAKYNRNIAIVKQNYKEFSEFKGLLIKYEDGR